MIIGAILPHLLLFGGVRRYLELGNQFVGRGHEFIIYTPAGRTCEWQKFDGRIATLDDLDNSFLDVIITGSPEYTGYLENSAARLKIFYLQLEDLAREREIVNSGKYRVMVNSSGLLSRVRERYGREPLPGIGGINPRLFHPLDGEDEAAAGSGRGAETPFRIMCYGRLSRPRKGTRFVIQAARWMYNHGFDVELDLFDSRVSERDDPRRGFAPGLPFRYYLDLPQDRMAAMYGAASVFVSVERRAGWANTAAEAAACGLPLVCTGSGTTDFAIPDRSALVLRTRNSYGIRKALIKLYRDPALAARLGGEARKRILDFTWEKVAGRMEETFHRLLREEESAGADSR
ncbi:MAG: glycosyltransferase family 4 protein [Candidatus Krumholzibacteriota bacterium]|nr:glycosyltransferase family 4 protein [Candidatus Krumholzibacteriota bacterium]